MEVEAGLVLLEGNLNPSLTAKAKTWVNNSLPLAFNNANILILIAINDRINPYGPYGPQERNKQNTKQVFIQIISQFYKLIARDCLMKMHVYTYRYAYLCIYMQIYVLRVLHVLIHN